MDVLTYVMTHDLIPRLDHFLCPLLLGILPVVCAEKRHTLCCLSIIGWTFCQGSTHPHLTVKTYSGDDAVSFRGLIWTRICSIEKVSFLRHPSLPPFIPSPFVLLSFPSFLRITIFLVFRLDYIRWGNKQVIPCWAVLGLEVLNQLTFFSLLFSLLRVALYLLVITG